MKERLKALWHAFSTFSDREGRRVLLLVPLLAALSLLFLWLDEPRFGRGFTQYAGRPSDSARSVGERGKASGDGAFRPEEPSGPALREEAATEFSPVRSAREVEPFFFDPNTVTGDELERLGFTAKQAAAILRYRSAGAVFRRAEDFARCYTVSERSYRRLEPYIRIAPDCPRTGSEEGACPENASAKVAEEGAAGASAGASDRESVPVKPSEKTSVPVELNGADSAVLTTLRGIGPLTAGRIVRYRERLGGYVAVEQLREIEGMTDRNFSLISQQIRVESSKIRKIDINFAHPSAMKGHPYLTDRMLNRILKYRQLKGGWRSIEDLTERHILTTDEADRLGPYLCFETK